MAELGAAACALQLIDFGGKLILRLSSLASSLKDAPASIRNLNSQLSQLLKIVETIQIDPNLQDSPDGPKALLEDCLSQIRDLDAILQGLTTDLSDNARERFWKALQSVQKEKKIENICKSLERHKTALSIWLICDVRAQSETVSTQNRSIINEFPAWRHQSQTIIDMGELLRSQLADHEARSRSLQTQEQQSATALQDLRSEVKLLQLQLIKKPSLLASISDHQLSPPNTEQFGTGARDLDRTYYRKVCTCRNTKSASKRRVGLGFWTFTSRDCLHSDTCSLFHTTPTEERFGFYWYLATTLASGAIQASITITRGAGGFAISPYLGYSGLLYHGSPAYQLLFNCLRTLQRSRPEDFGKVLNQLDMGMRDVFFSGRGSPKDLTEDGDSILHVTLSLISRIISWRKGSFDNCFKFFTALVAAMVQYGVPLDVIDDHNRSALDLWLYPWPGFESCSSVAEEKVQQSVAFLQSLVGMGADFVCPYHDEIDFHFPVLICQNIGEFGSAIGCAALSLAVLRRSKSDTTDIIQRFPGQLHMRNSLGQRPLHLASNWAFGTTLLLQNGASPNCSDYNGKLPINYACRLGCIETVELLLETDCALEDPTSRSSLLSDAIAGGSEDVIHRIIAALKDRHTRLRALALRLLPIAEVEKLGLDDNTIHDSYAVAVRQSITKLGFVVPEPLHFFHTQSVYDTYNITVHVANQLHLNGFRDIDALNRRGCHMMSDFMVTRTVTDNRERRLLVWYFTQGADISMLSKVSEHTILQDMVWYFGMVSRTNYNRWLRKYPKEENIEIDNIKTKLFRGVIDFKVLSSNCQDGVIPRICRCHCACLTKGCSYISLFTRSYLEAPRSGLYHSERSDRYWMYLQLIFTWFCIVNPSKESEEMTCLEFARSVMFEELGVSHLCRDLCRFRYERYSAEEEEEIRTEELGLVFQLEKAMAKYTSLRSTSNARPLEFLVRTWFPYLIERSSPHWDADEASRMATAGVCNIRSDTFSLRGDDFCDSPFETDTAQEQTGGWEINPHALETAALITKVQNQSMTLLRIMTREDPDSIEIFARQNLINVQEVDGSE